MTKRPAIVELDDMLVGLKPEPPRPEKPPKPEKPKPEKPRAPAVRAKAKPHYTGQTSSYDPDVLRTSIYFHRAIHDVLREIAYTDRKTISGLIMEGLDKVLAQNGRPDTKTLIAEFRAKQGGGE